VEGELCTGCGLCASLAGGAIRIDSVEPGYNRPQQIGPVDARAEQAIAETCPGAVVARWTGPAVHPYWGPWRSISTGAATDEAVRFEGSSGGAISALLIHALESGAVDRVLHVAADPADPTRNVTAVSRTAAEVIARAGSRYTASSPLEAILAAVAEGGRMAFVGKPCDASALRRLAAIDDRVAQAVPLVVSFFCGGIPSHAGVGRILKTLDVAAEAVTEFRFRGRGWPGNCVAVTPAGAAEMSYAQSWGGHLSRRFSSAARSAPTRSAASPTMRLRRRLVRRRRGLSQLRGTGRPQPDHRAHRSRRAACWRPLLARRTDRRAACDRRDRQDAALAGPPEAADPRPHGGAAVRPAQPRPRMRGLSVMRAAARANPGEFLRNFLGTLRRTWRGTRSRL
jgi:coenzyme F420 hydrogenase subunit beta